MKRIAIIGGGFAGLAAAVRLCDAGCPVVLLERRQQLGGRAFSFADPATGDTIDNGQHLFMKCYRDTLDFLARIGARDDIAFQPQFDIDFRHPTRGASNLRFPSALPAPLNLLLGFLRFRAIRWSDIPPLRKINAALHKALDPCLSVHAWLDQCDQKPRMRAAFWHPLCLAALNQRPQQARACHLQAVLREAFWQADGACLGYANRGLSTLVAHRAREYICNRGGEIHFGTAITAIAPARTGIQLRTRSEKVYKPEACIAAVPPLPLARLLPVTPFAKLRHTLCQYEPSPILSVNLWFDRPIMHAPMCGLLGTTMEWVFDKAAIYGDGDHASHLAMVASAAHHLMHQPNRDLIALACKDLYRVFSESQRANLLRATAIRERAATSTLPLAHTPPKTHTSHPQLFLAGDWTGTGLPATIESAVRSGHAAADAVLSK